MRIHTDRLTASDFYSAALIARVDLDLTHHGSRSRERAFNVNLRGESRRWTNSGTRGSGGGYAATWDQWGVFLSVLFTADSERVFEPSRGMTTPYYDDADDFHRQTDDRFRPRKWVGQVLTFLAIDRLPGEVVWWPTDAHGDHTFRFDGTAYERACTKCSAVHRWGARSVVNTH